MAAAARGTPTEPFEGRAFSHLSAHRPHNPAHARLKFEIPGATTTPYRVQKRSGAKQEFADPGSSERPVAARTKGTCAL